MQKIAIQLIQQTINQSIRRVTFNNRSKLLNELYKSPNFSSPTKVKTIYLSTSAVSAIKKSAEVTKRQVQYYLDKEDYEAVRYYHDRMNDLVKLVPEYTHDTRNQTEQIIVQKSRRLFSSFHEILNRQIVKFNAQKQSFSKLLWIQNQLRKFSKFSTPNSDHAKSSRDLQDKIVKTEAQLLQNINPLIDKEIIQKIVQVISRYKTTFADIVPGILEKAKKRCQTYLAEYRKNIYHNFQNVSPHAFDTSCSHYQTIWLFFDAFKFNDNTEFKPLQSQLNEFQKSVRQKLKQMNASLKEICEKSQKHLPLTKDPVETIGQCVDFLQRIKDSDHLNLSKEIQDGEDALSKTILKMSETMKVNILNYYEFPPDFASLTHRMHIDKANLQLVSTINIAEIRELIQPIGNKINIRIQQKIESFTYELVQLITKTKNEDNISNIIALNFINLEERVAELSLHSVAQLSLISSQGSLTDLLMEFKNSFKSFTGKLQSWLATVDLQKAERESIGAIYLKLNNYWTYESFCDQFGQNILKTKEAFRVKIQVYCKGLAEEMRVKENPQGEIHFKFNIALLKTYIDKVLENQRKSAIYQETKPYHGLVFQQMLKLFEKVTSLIGAFRDQYASYERLIQAKIHVESILTIYSQLKSIYEDPPIRQYLLCGRNEFGKNNIEIQESIQQIEAVCKDTYQILQQKAHEWRRKPTNMQVPLQITRLCKQLNILAKSIKRSSNEPSTSDVMDFEQLQNKTNDDMWEANKKQLNNMERCFDMEENKIRSFNILIKLYDHLAKNISHEGLGSSITDNLQQFVENLDMCLQNKTKLSRDYLHACENILSTESISRFSEDKKFFLLLRRLLQPQHQNFLKDFCNYVGQFKELIKIGLQFLKNKIDEQIDETDFHSANVLLLKIEKAYKLICFNDSEDYDPKEFEQYQDTIKKLKQKKEQLEKKVEDVLQNPFSSQNRSYIMIIFPKRNEIKKISLVNKLKAYYEEECFAYSRNEGLNTKKYEQIQEVITSFPEQINNKFYFMQRLNIEHAQKKEREKELLKKIQCNEISLHIIFKKLQNYQVNKDGFLIQQCEIKIIQYLDKSITSLLHEQTLLGIIERTKELMWKGPLSEAPSSVSSAISLRQTNIFYHISKLLTKKMDQVIDVEENRVKAKDVPTSKIIKEIFQVYDRLKSQFKVKALPNHIKNVLNHIINFQTNIQVRFRKLSSQKFDFFSEIAHHADEVKNILRKILTKIFIIQKMIQNGTNEMERCDQNQNKPISSDDENPIGSVVAIYRENIFNLISNPSRFLNEFSFHHKSYENNPKLVDEDFQDIDKKLIFLKVYTSVYLELEDNLFPAIDVPQLERGLRQKFYALIDQVKCQFQQAISNIEVEVPAQLYQLETMLSCIKRGHAKCLLMIPEDEMSDRKMYDHAGSNIYLLIEDKIKELQTSLKASGEILVSFYDVTFPENEEKKRTLSQQYAQKMINLVNEEEDKISETKEKNAGKIQSDISDMIMEVKKSFSAQKQDIEIKYQENKKEIENSNATELKGILVTFCTLLLVAKKIGFNIKNQRIQEKCESLIKHQLQKIDSMKEVGLKIIREVSEMLNSCSVNNYAYMIKNQNKQFKWEAIKEFNEKTKAQGLQYILENISNKANHPIDKYAITTEFNLFHFKFKACLAQYISQPSQNTIRKIADSIRDTNVSSQEIAVILAVWSMLNCEGKVVNDEYLLKPHPVQVVSILLLIQDGNAATSKLAQVLTGEGKSIVLATLACYFAKKGREVSVACFSSYLSRRDWSSFEELFGIFNVREKIFYGTFNEICERLLDSSGSKFKDVIIDYFTKKNWYQKIGQMFKGLKGIFSLKKKENNNILLIDEVDVFFEKEFFGKLYRPTISLRGEEITKLISLIWENSQKEERLSIPQLQKSAVFQALIDKYPNLENILRNQLNGLARAVRNFRQNHEYQIHERQIKYQDNDTLSTKVSFGYKTVFAYCFERDRGMVDEVHYEQAMKIALTVGEFSYSVLPSYFNFILGLSGSLSVVSDPKIKMLTTKYSIEKTNIFLLPSIYGHKHKRQIRFIFEKQSQINARIIKETLEKIQQGRPVVICFENLKQLLAFRNSPEFASLDASKTELHELLDHEIRDKNIKTAGGRKRVMLMTAMFARGTDLVVSEEFVRTRGGLHLIITYIPASESDDKQVQGRTARQGDPGSVDYIIPEEIVPEEYRNAQEFQSKYLYQKWETDESQDLGKRLKLVDDLEERHNRTMSCFSNWQKNEKEFIESVFQLNIHPEFKDKFMKKTRVVIGVDGTTSMAEALTAFLSKLRVIIKRINEMKNKLGFSSISEIQIVIYRNYNSTTKLLEFSEFHSDPEPLCKFLSKIQTNGGMGREAIEIFYQHVNSLTDVNAIIVVGDAPPNLPEDANNYRKQPYWKHFPNRKKFEATDHFKEESKIIEKKIPIHSLYILSQNGFKVECKKYFQSISKETKGDSMELKIGEAKCQDDLTDFFAKKILTAGTEMSKQIEEAYELEYNIRYRQNI